MKLIVSHTSALRAVALHRAAGGGRIEPANVRSLADCACSRSAVERMAPPRLLERPPLHVLVGSAAQSCRSAIHTCHVVTAPLPAHAFAHLAGNVYAPTPEFLFVQMAYSLPFTDLLLLGMELCGTYTMRAQEPLGFDGCPQITTRERLRAFAERAGSIRGAAAARRATRFIIDGANSPAESALALFLSLPVRMGGYGMPAPSLNPAIALDARGQLALGQARMRCDLHWLDRNVALEYNSSQEHLSSHAAAQDARRANVLEAQEVRLFAVTPAMIAAPQAFDQTAVQLAAALGKRLAPNALNFTPKRADLRTRLFPWLIVRD